MNKKRGANMVIMLVYVDDLMITGNNPQLVTKLKSVLEKNFKMKDLGQL